MNISLEELKNKIDYRMVNGSDLAYLGDAYYELYIRSYLLAKGITKPKDLHKKVQVFVMGASHAKVVDAISDGFTDEERDIYTRGRNYNYHHKPKSASVNEYVKSSGFEAVIGYLYLTNRTDRLNEIMTKAIEIIEGTNE